MAYFENFPLVSYDLDSNKNKITTNILTRTKIIDSIKNASYVYYTYDVQDGDTPEILSSKYYDDPNKHWIILMANDIIDPVYDWPLSSNDFGNFIVDKYGSYANATNQVHHYEKIITKTDSVTQTTTINKYVIDLDTYNFLPASSYETINLKDGNTVSIQTTKKLVSAYEYENELNESKRTIKIIDRVYVSQIENEFASLMNQNG